MCRKFAIVCHHDAGRYGRDREQRRERPLHGRAEAIEHTAGDDSHARGSRRHAATGSLAKDPPIDDACTRPAQVGESWTQTGPSSGAGSAVTSRRRR